MTLSIALGVGAGTWNVLVALKKWGINIRVRSMLVGLLVTVVGVWVNLCRLLLPKVQLTIWILWLNKLLLQLLQIIHLKYINVFTAAFPSLFLGLEPMHVLFLWLLPGLAPHVGVQIHAFQRRLFRSCIVSIGFQIFALEVVGLAMAALQRALWHNILA